MTADERDLRSPATPARHRQSALRDLPCVIQDCFYINYNRLGCAIIAAILGQA
jgi:hypothetical protein